MADPAINRSPDDLPDGSPVKADGEASDLRRRLDYDIIEPVGWRVVIRKDDNRRQTKSGIVLPDSKEIPVITGRIVAVSREVEGDTDVPLRVYDKVLFDPREAIPVELDHDNRLFVVNVDHVLGVFRRSRSPSEGSTDAVDEAEDTEEPDSDEDDPDAEEADGDE
jgi:chaperonin GroES